MLRNDPKSDIGSDSGKYHAELLALKKEKENSNFKISQISKENFQYREEIQNLLEQVQEYQNQIDELRQINENAKNNMGLAIQSVEKAKELEKNYKNLQNQNSKLAQELQAVRKNWKDAQGLLNNFETKKEKEDSYEIEKSETLRARLAETQNQLDEARNEIKTLLREKLKLLDKQEESPTRNGLNKRQRETIEEIEIIMKEKAELQDTIDTLLETKDNLELKIQESERKSTEQLRKLKEDLEEKSKNIEALVSELESSSYRGEEEDKLKRALDLQKRQNFKLEEKSNEEIYQLRMLYSRVNYILQRITGRNLSDKISDSLLILDLKSKIETLVNEVDSLLRDQKQTKKKFKDLELKNQNEHESDDLKDQLLQQLREDFQMFEVKIEELEENESGHLLMVKKIKNR